MFLTEEVLTEQPLGNDFPFPELVIKIENSDFLDFGLRATLKNFQNFLKIFFNLL